LFSNTTERKNYLNNNPQEKNKSSEKKREEIQTSHAWFTVLLTAYKLILGRGNQFSIEALTIIRPLL
jgi:hypothetical protein